MLAGVKIIVAPGSRIELGVRAALYDFAMFHHEDLVSTANGGKAMRDDERAAPLHQISETLLDHLFGFGVEAGSCFVQNQNPRLSQNRAGNGDPLPLSS